MVGPLLFAGAARARGCRAAGEVSMFMRVTPKHRSTSEKSRRLKRSLRIDWSAENEVARRMIDGIGTRSVDDVSPDHECQFRLPEKAAFLLLAPASHCR